MPDPDSKSDPENPEFEVAYYTKELGKTIQRKMLQQRLAQLGSDSSFGETVPGEEPPPQAENPPPDADRAG